jgi:hypothetical protein
MPELKFALDFAIGSRQGVAETIIIWLDTKLRVW